MELLTNTIQINHIDKEINSVIDKISTMNTNGCAFGRCFSYKEEFFLSLKEEFTVPHFTIHHDVRLKKPEKQYINSIKEFLNQLLPLVPQVFMELIYFFNPGEILRPSFFKLYKVENTSYLYILQLDLLFKANYARIFESGNNDLTPLYKTNNLFIDAAFIPLSEVVVDKGKIEAFKIKQTISETWIGEHGRGYLVKGIWIDDELTKFFTKLFLPKGKNIYPYYPFLCKYKTICQSVIYLSPEQRKKTLPYLHRAYQFLFPVMREIEKVMKNNRFSENLTLFQELKKKLPDYWNNLFNNLEVTAYLNENDMKEFKIENKVK